jgi:hypothetical protein
MRKILIIALVALVPLMAFGQTFQIGATALWDLPVTAENVTSLPLTEVGLDDFTFGADVRLRLFKILEISGLGLYSPSGSYEDIIAGGTILVPATVDVFADAGLYLGLGFIGAGIGIGPNFRIPIDPGVDVSPFQLGFNAKAHADVNLGSLGISLTYLMYMPELTQDAFTNLAENLTGSLGISVLYNL